MPSIFAAQSCHIYVQTIELFSLPASAAAGRLSGGDVLRLSRQ